MFLHFGFGRRIFRENGIQKSDWFRISGFLSLNSKPTFLYVIMGIIISNLAELQYSYYNSNIILEDIEMENLELSHTDDGNNEWVETMANAESFSDAEQKRAQYKEKLKGALTSLERELDGNHNSNFASLEDFAKYLISEAKLEPNYVVENYQNIRDAVLYERKGVAPNEENQTRFSEDGHDLLLEELQHHMYDESEVSQEEIDRSNKILDDNYRKRMESTFHPEDK